MIVRITQLSIKPEDLQKVRQVFEEEVIPVVRQQKGNLNIRLLEPIEPGDDIVSLTEWETAEDATAYDSSGVYRELVSKMKDSYLKKPVLKTYKAELVGDGVQHA